MPDVPHTDDTQILVGSIPTQLWAVEITYLPPFPNEDAVARWFDQLTERGIPEDEQEFYWPTLSKIYRSRSGARERLALFESYGARGHLVTATPNWHPAETKDQKIARLEARVAELEQQPHTTGPTDIVHRIEAGEIAGNVLEARIAHLYENGGLR